MKRKPKNPAYDELKEMIPTALIVNGLIMVGISLYGIFEGITWRAMTGLLLGNLLFAGNFILAGAGAVSAITKSSAKQGKVSASISYGARYIGLFACLAIGLTLKIIDLIPAFLPLFIPKIHYTVQYVFFKKEYRDLDSI